VTEGPDPERLLAEALRAQAVSTPLPPAKQLSLDEPARDAEPGPAADGPGEPAESVAAEKPPAGEIGVEAGSFGTSDGARLVDLLSGAGHRLFSGREPDTDAPYSPRRGDRAATGPVSTTKLNAQRPPLAWWWIVMLAIALGLACGAMAGVLSLL
jgi:hypothetical protein